MGPGFAILEPMIKTSVSQSLLSRPSTILTAGVLATFLMSGCSTTKTTNSAESAAPLKVGRSYQRHAASAAPVVSATASTPTSPSTIGVEASELGLGEDAEVNDDVSESGEVQSKETVMRNIEAIPAEDNESVQKWITFFTTRDRERFQRFLDRGEKYRALIETVLEENELPAELYFLAMIESGFNTHAHSTAKAKGVWQFMPATGKRYGLEVSSTVDERRDPIRATEAAARYLRDLHNVFGSWHLAMAAYNAGETRIMNVVFRGRSRNFWDLAKRKVLPTETANYVPKFLAAMTIAREYKRYGFRTPAMEALPSLTAVEVPSPVQLKSVAKASGVSLAVLEEANPHLFRGVTSRGSRTYELWVPSKLVAQIQNSRNDIARGVFKPRLDIVPEAQAQTSESANASIHVVRRGENLSLIAKKYGVSTAFLKKSNSLSSGRIHPGQRLRVNSLSSVAVKKSAPIRREPSVAAAPRASGSNSKRVAAKSSSDLIRYKVKRGDNLNQIARRFGTSVSNLKKKNSLRRDQVFIGQTLVVDSRLRAN